jgi:hypothetical protein
MQEVEYEDLIGIAVKHLKIAITIERNSRDQVKMLTGNGASVSRAKPTVSPSGFSQVMVDNSGLIQC